MVEHLFAPAPPHRQAALRRLTDSDGELIDEGLLLVFPQGGSFTGEAVLEFQCHGSPLLADAVVQRFIACGARPARAGEFSERAFLNGRIDLTQAEAIADLIEADTLQAARAAQRSLSGAFSQRVHALCDQLIALRVSVEAAIDFPDEEVDILEEIDAETRLSAWQVGLHCLQQEASAGAVLREGIVIALAGAPNAGKSSLLNALSRQDSAIVTDTPGTTRDVLSVRLALNGVAFEFRDTAGLRDTEDTVEKLGIERAKRAMQESDLVLHVVDASQLSDSIAQLPEIDGARVQLLLNKVDLLEPTEIVTLSQRYPSAHITSVASGLGLAELERQLSQRFTQAAGGEGIYSARRRHLDALNQAKQHVATAESSLQQGVGVELVAEELRLAQQSLDEITGRFSSDDLLGEIFSSFCIGK
jgi:tRNA modification GTPase